MTAALMWVIVAEVPAWLIAKLTQQTELLHQIAQTDALTQLLDRSTLGHQLSLHTGESTIVLIDLDNFKQYNDTHGHAAATNSSSALPTRCAGRCARTTSSSGSG